MTTAATGTWTGRRFVLHYLGNHFFKKCENKPTHCNSSVPRMVTDEYQRQNLLVASSVEAGLLLNQQCVKKVAHFFVRGYLPQYFGMVS
jgi:hypothetical protein